MRHDHTNLLLTLASTLGLRSLWPEFFIAVDSAQQNLLSRGLPAVQRWPYGQVLESDADVGSLMMVLRVPACEQWGMLKGSLTQGSRRACMHR